MTIEALYEIYRQHPSIVTDTRKIKRGDIFFALTGPSFNGNTFADKALELGASHVVVDDKSLAGRPNFIFVENVLQSLQLLALHHRKQFHIPFIAITGSNGKTTTKELMHAVLSKKYKCYTTEGNLNNHIGIPITLLKIKPDAEVAIVEMGANHLQEIAAYCRYTLPTHGLITNLGKAHLEGFGSVEGVRKGKGELLEYLKAHKGTAFIYADDPYLKNMAEGMVEVRTYGCDPGADISGKTLPGNSFLSFQVIGDNELAEIHTQLVGNYNLPNALAAICTGKYFSVPVSQIKEAIESYIPNNSRSQLIERDGNKIILDAYNANPSSMKAAVENFAALLHPSKVLVLGSMKELGEETLSEHQSLADLAAKYEWQDVILAGSEFDKVCTSFKKVANYEEAKNQMHQLKLKDAMILIKGSRGMQMEKVLE